DFRFTIFDRQSTTLKCAGHHHDENFNELSAIRISTDYRRLTTDDFYFQRKIPMPLQAGIAKIDITPPPEQPMYGYPPLQWQMDGAPADTSNYFGRDGLAEGTHDPLFARALVLDNGEQTIAMVALDIGIVNKPFTQEIRAAVQETTGIPGEHILLNTSHTHSGPDLFHATQDLDPKVKPVIQQKIIEAIRQAHTNRQPARVGWADGHLETIAINRREDEGPINPRVGVMVVENEAKQPLALVVNFAVHPIVLSAANRHYTGDLPGYAMAALERIYPDSVALFLNGCAGNINPVAYPWGQKANIVPVFREAWHAGHPHPRTFRNAARLGHILAGTVLQTAEQVEQFETEVHLTGAIHSVRLPLRPSEELSKYNTFFGKIKDYSVRLREGHFETEVQALAIGSTLYIGLPGEPFVELGLELEQRLQPSRAYVFGYSNDDTAYILHRDAYEDNRYETWGSMVQPGSGEILIDEAEKVARTVQDI
ncbi:MAG: neutral/alkaline non-lysosomal ceramidase N-terminal domain-containing protein, partial [Chloroflexota bacterium]